MASSPPRGPTPQTDTPRVRCQRRNLGGKRGQGHSVCSITPSANIHRFLAGGQSPGGSRRDNRAKCSRGDGENRTFSRMSPEPACPCSAVGRVGEARAGGHDSPAEAGLRPPVCAEPGLAHLHAKSRLQLGVPGSGPLARWRRSRETPQH